MSVPIPQPLLAIAKLLQRFPGVGEKTAMKYTLALAEGDFAVQLGEALEGLPFVVQPCARCRVLVSLTESECVYCARSPDMLCIVQRFVDLLAIERAAGALKMRFFVLGKLLSPLEGIHEEDLPLPLLRPLADEAKEIVLALPPSVEGEATGLLLRRELQHPRMTQLARGLPHGGDLEYADAITLRGAFDKRTEGT
jgi:recombination protein RecR